MSASSNRTRPSGQRLCNRHSPATIGQLIDARDLGVRHRADKIGTAGDELPRDLAAKYPGWTDKQ
jgi:hypothetical protein